mmetsp:Transcript_57384/g.174771  ORF Transcript_57384/g.174771 Transcript_57384/m.174771 type:complete len:225 (-) Transcript_57384:58-732(-)
MSGALAISAPVPSAVPRSGSTFRSKCACIHSGIGASLAGRQVGGRSGPSGSGTKPRGRSPSLSLGLAWATGGGSLAASSSLGAIAPVASCTASWSIIIFLCLKKSLPSFRFRTLQTSQSSQYDMPGRLLCNSRWRCRTGLINWQYLYASSMKSRMPYLDNGNLAKSMLLVPKDWTGHVLYSSKNSSSWVAVRMCTFHVRISMPIMKNMNWQSSILDRAQNCNMQ